MHLNWVLVASKMQSLRHGFAKRTTMIAPLLTLRFKCRTAYRDSLTKIYNTLYNNACSLKRFTQFND